jgi:hypothetical protein
MYDPIIVCLTTTPDRIRYLNFVIESLLHQTVKPDKIVLNIPYKCKNKTYNIPEIFDSDIIFINRCKDLGPATKLIPTLYLDISPNSIIVTVDDDTYLHPNTISIIKRKSKIYPNSVFSFSGRCVGKFPFCWGLEACNEIDKSVDWVEGVHSITYRRWMLDGDQIVNFKDNMKKDLGDIVNFNDDHVISAYLSHKNINRISINKRPIDYFFNLEHKHIGGISDRKLHFWLENIKIGKYLVNKGYYGVNPDYTNTVTFNAVVTPIIFFMNNKIFLLLWCIHLYIFINTNIKLKYKK